MRLNFLDISSNYDALVSKISEISGVIKNDEREDFVANLSDIRKKFNELATRYERMVRRTEDARQMIRYKIWSIEDKRGLERLKEFIEKKVLEYRMNIDDEVKQLERTIQLMLEDAHDFDECSVTESDGERCKRLFNNIVTVSSITRKIEKKFNDLREGGRK